ncbi:MAG: hypothetical protein HOP33_22165 [Verrucomicrobia bacterium]|nr:hypothetical protein [Verrucomicrobiota bacterium]
MEPGNRRSYKEKAAVAYHLDRTPLGLVVGDNNISAAGDYITALNNPTGSDVLHFLTLCCSTAEK